MERVRHVDADNTKLRAYRILCRKNKSVVTEDEPCIRMLNPRKKSGNKCILLFLEPLDCTSEHSLVVNTAEGFC